MICTFFPVIILLILKVVISRQTHPSLAATTKRWTRVSSANAPSPRACHTAFAYGELLLLFGGEYASSSNKSEIYNEIIVLFTGTLTNGVVQWLWCCGVV